MYIYTRKWYYIVMSETSSNNEGGSKEPAFGSPEFFQNLRDTMSDEPKEEITGSDGESEKREGPNATTDDASTNIKETLLGLIAETPPEPTDEDIDSVFRDITGFGVRSTQFMTEWGNLCFHVPKIHPADNTRYANRSWTVPDYKKLRKKLEAIACETLGVNDAFALLKQHCPELENDFVEHMLNEAQSAH